MINEIKKQIEQCEIISFDIFDTLLLRPYYKPEDLFLHLEYIYNVSNFKNLRISAEDIARKNLIKDAEITFEQIYKNVPEQYQYLQEKELDLEYQTLQPNKEMIDIFNFAKQLNKKIIIVSDIYLSFEFIQKILQKNGIAEYTKLYISSKENKKKRSGSLFKKVLEDFKVQPNKIFHIGDNKNSDYLIPQQIGITSFLYKKVINQFLDNNEIFKHIIKKKNLSLGLSIILGICAINYKNNYNSNYFYNLGFNIAGSSNYIFCNFINDELITNKIDHLLFVTRDGYTIEKSFKYFNNVIPTDYVVLNRFQKFINKLIDNELPNDNECIKILNYIKLLYPKNEICNKINNSINNAKNFIIENIDTIKKLLSKYKDTYYKYIKDKISINSKNVAIIDSTTTSFSAAKLAQEILTDKNIYSITLQTKAKQKPQNIKVSYMLKPKNKYDGFENWNLMEFFFSAPTTQVLGIDFDKNFIYEQENKFEKSNISIYEYVSNGMIDFTKIILNIFDNYKTFIDINDAKTLVETLCIYYTDYDYENIKKIFHSSRNDVEYHQIITNKSKFERKLNYYKKKIRKYLANKLV